MSINKHSLLILKQWRYRSAMTYLLATFLKRLFYFYFKKNEA